MPEQTSTETLITYEDAAPRIKRLISSWDRQKIYVRDSRRARQIDVDTEQLQAKGILKSDENFIPIRVIDSNIEKERPSYINFLVGSSRLAIFKCLSKQNHDTSRLETEVTDGLKYVGWEDPQFKVLDGGIAHGWDGVEVEYDVSKPLHIGINHIGNENLIFPAGLKSIQASDILIIRYKVTKPQLEQWVKKYGFEATQVERYLDSEKELTEKNEPLDVYKCYLKLDGVVFVAWYVDKTADGWLKAPAKLDLGIRKKVTSVVNQLDPVTGITMPTPQESWQPVDITEYPAFIFIYNVTEDGVITNSKGRVFKDLPEQEAQTAIWCSFVNGSVRACNVYGSPKEDMSNGSSPAQLDLSLEHGKLYNTPIMFWNTPFPDPQMIKASQSLSVAKAQERGQTDFAVSNREDSRKTAQEIKTASAQAVQLSTVQVALYSGFLRRVYNQCWVIIQSLALQEEIKLLQEVVMEMDAMGNEVEVRKNNLVELSYEYMVKAAGDVDVVERAQILSTMQSFWQIISQTPLANEFLIDMIRIALPNYASKYEKVLRAQDPRAILAGVAGVLESIVTGENGQIKPEFMNYAPQLMQLKQQVQMAVGAGEPTKGE